MSGAALVLDFFRAWERRDIEAILALLHPGIVYQNVPSPELRGRAAVRDFITPTLTAAKGITWMVRHCIESADGRLVATERIDAFRFSEGDVVVGVMGMIEIADGLIWRWRDYADLSHFARQMAAIGRVPNPQLAVVGDHAGNDS
jgi:limonene-1,2-epoxide hydrolase